MPRTMADMISDFDELLRHIRPLLPENGAPIEVDAEDSLTVTWPSCSLMVDRFAVSTNRTSMRRLTADQSPEPGEHVHLWMYLKDSADKQLLSRQSADPAALAALLDQWFHPPVPNPIELTVEGLSSPLRGSVRLTIDIPESLPGEESLCPEDASALANLLRSVDPDVLSEHWPLDAKGRPSPRTTVVLAVFGQTSTTKKQPCLTVTSGTLKDATACASISLLFVDNARHNWSELPWLWRNAGNGEPVRPVSDPPTTEPGWFDRCADSHGIIVDDSVRLLAAGQPTSKVDQVSPSMAGRVAEQSGGTESRCSSLGDGLGPQPG